MEVMTIEATAYKSIVGKLEEVADKFTTLAEENKKLKDDRWMDISEVSKYTGFCEKWVRDRKFEFGFFQDGGKDIRLKKSKVEEYMTKHFIQRKTK